MSDIDLINNLRIALIKTCALEEYININKSEEFEFDLKIERRDKVDLSYKGDETVVAIIKRNVLTGCEEYTFLSKEKALKYIESINSIINRIISR